MKKNITVNLETKGTIKIPRAQVVQIIYDWVKKNHGELSIDRSIAVDKDDKPVPFDHFIAYVSKKVETGKITKKFDPQVDETHKVKKGFSRPNYGIGKFIREYLLHTTETVRSIDIFYTHAKDKFPKLTKKTFDEFLRRPEMTGGPVEIVDGMIALKKKDNVRKLNTGAKTA